MGTAIKNKVTENTLPKLFRRNYNLYGADAIALREKDRGIWKSYTWAEYYQNVKQLSLCLLKLGLDVEDKVGIIGENKPEAYYAEMATLAARGVAMGIFTDCGPEEIKYFINLCDIKFLVVHDQEQVDKIISLKHEIPGIKKVIYWDPKGLWDFHDPLFMSMDDAFRIGQDYEHEHPGLFETNIENGQPEDIAIICATSGTTGLPKAAMLSHGGLVTMAHAFHATDAFGVRDSYLSFVPVAWITEQVFGIASALYSGFPVNFPERPETVQINIRELGPTILFFGARQWESTNRMVQAKILNSTWLKRKVYQFFLPVGEKMVDVRARNHKPGLGLRILHALAHVSVFRSLKDNLGLSRVSHCYTAGSGISPQLIRFFQAIGVNIKLLYGSSEMSIVTAHRDGDIRPETSGLPLPGVKIQLSEEGEILVQNEAMFVGYYKNKTATDKMFINGWYKSGDFGHIDDNDHLVVIDRMEDLRSLKGNERFSPQFLEARLRFCPFIKEVMVVGGEERAFPCTIVSIDLENVGTWAESRKIVYTTFADLSQKDEVLELLSSEIKKINKTVPKSSRIMKFISLYKEFDPDEEEVTRTRKLRRSFLELRYKALIEALYSEQRVLDVEMPIVYRDGRKGAIKGSMKINTVN